MKPWPGDSTGSTGLPGRPLACSALRTRSRTRHEGCASPAGRDRIGSRPLLLSAEALGQMFLGSLPAATRAGDRGARDRSHRRQRLRHLQRPDRGLPCRLGCRGPRAGAPARRGERRAGRGAARPADPDDGGGTARPCCGARWGSRCDLTDLAELAGGWDLPLIPLWRSGYLEALTRAALADGDHGEAERYATAAEAAGPAAWPSTVHSAARVRPRSRLAGGDPGAAAELALASAAEAERVGAQG